MSKSIEIVIPERRIENKILLIRKKKVMLDKDLATLYGVTTGRLNEQVQRNRKRFPADFMFQLNHREFKFLISQNAISSWGGTRKLPYAFTEQGVAMLSSVLNSDRAIQVNIQIMRIFTKLREVMSSHKGLADKIKKLEIKFKEHDRKFIVVFEAIRRILNLEEESAKLPIGFHSHEE